MEISGLRILVVEDDPDSRQALCTILESMGHQIFPFPSAKSAIEQFPTLQIDLAMLDIMMPEMNGYELLGEMRKIDKFEKTPVFMVTAKDQWSDTLDGYKHGADYYIGKPFTAEQIRYGIKMFFDMPD